MNECLFCRIGLKEVPAKFVYEDPEIFAFQDIQPQAPAHILICPRKHLASLGEASAEDAALLGRLLLVAAQGNRYFTCTCTCWVAGRSAGHRGSAPDSG